MKKKVKTITKEIKISTDSDIKAMYDNTTESELEEYRHFKFEDIGAKVLILAENRI